MARGLIDPGASGPRSDALKRWQFGLRTLMLLPLVLWFAVICTQYVLEWLRIRSIRHLLDCSFSPFAKEEETLIMELARRPGANGLFDVLGLAEGATRGPNMYMVAYALGDPPNRLRAYFFEPVALSIPPQEPEAVCVITDDSLGLLHWHVISPDFASLRTASITIARDGKSQVLTIEGDALTGHAVVRYSLSSNGLTELGRTVQSVKVRALGEPNRQKPNGQCNRGRP